jgi:putative ABC transport system permease protein
MNKLIFANLLHRPIRSIISVLAVAIEVVMILSIVAIFMGMLNDQKTRNNGIGADLMMRPSNSSVFLGVSGAPMSAKLVDVLRRLPHVAVASPVIQKFNATPKIEILYGIEYPSFDALKSFVFVSGGPFQGPNDAIIDDIAANADGGHHVGEPISILGRSFRIAGIVEHGKGGRKLLPIDTMGDLMGDEGKASLFYIRCDDPANENAVIQEIHATRGLEDYPVETIDEWLGEMTPSKIPGFNLALKVVITIAIIVGILVIFQTMYTAVLERTRELGILKSMGASKTTIVGVVLRECLALAIVGVLVGIAATFGVREFLDLRFPGFSFELTTAWIGRGALIALGSSICGALYPAWIAASKDPIDALAYE